MQCGITVMTRTSKEIVDARMRLGVAVAREAIWNDLVQISQATHLAEMRPEKSGEMNEIIRHHVERIIGTLKILGADNL